MSEKVRTLEDLILWQKAHLLVLFIYSTKKNPNEKKFGLFSQMRKTAVLVSSNILDVSLSEINTQLKIALKLKFISTSKFEAAV